MSALKEFRRSCVDKIIKVLDKTIPSRAERDHGTLCFSQTGEDGILNCFLPSQGFYIDVGAHHPCDIPTHICFIVEGGEALTSIRHPAR